MHVELTTGARPVDRPTWVWVAIVLEVFTGLLAVPVGIAFLADPTGNALGLPGGWIEATPFGSYAAPGLYLLFINGLGMLVLAGLSVVRHWTAPWLTGVLGVGLIVWIAASPGDARDDGPDLGLPRHRVRDERGRAVVASPYRPVAPVVNATDVGRPRSEGSPMRRFIRLALVVLVIPLLAACRLGTPGVEHEIGSGNAATETREVGAFDRLDVSAAIQATVTVGTPASVTVNADDNLLDNVVTTVSGTRLTVGMSGSTSARTTVRVDIVAPSLTAIHAGSAATVDVQGLTADQLRLEAEFGRPDHRRGDGSGDRSPCGQRRRAAAR